MIDRTGGDDLRVVSRGDLERLVSDHRAWTEDLSAERGRLELSHVRIEEATLDGAELLEAVVTASVLRQCRFVRCDFTRALLTECRFEDCVLEGCTLFRANLGGSVLAGVRVYDSDWSRASLFRTNLQGAEIRGGTLQGAELGATDLRGARLVDVDVTGTRWSGALVHNAHFEALRGVDRMGYVEVDLSPSGDGSQMAGVELFTRAGGV